MYVYVCVKLNNMTRCTGGKRIAHVCLCTGMAQEVTNTFPREESQSTLVENQSQSTLQSILEETLSQTTLEEDDKKTQSLETTV